jgi:hypothetical protein
MSNRSRTRRISRGRSRSQSRSRSRSQSRRRSKSQARSRSRRGGFLGSIINEAIVPFSILGLQQNYKKKSKGGKHMKMHKTQRRH